MSKMTNKELRKIFLEFNEGFFANELNPAEWSVKFEDIDDDETDAETRFGAREIVIDGRLKDVRNYVRILMLHEMAYAKLDIKGYRGYVDSGGHGQQFQLELDRLYRTGCYEGLL